MLVLHDIYLSGVMYACTFITRHLLIGSYMHLCLYLSSCEDIVRLRTQDRIASGDEMAEKELNDLQGLKVGTLQY